MLQSFAFGLAIRQPSFYLSALPDDSTIGQIPGTTYQPLSVPVSMPCDWCYAHTTGNSRVDDRTRSLSSMSQPKFTTGFSPPYMHPFHSIRSFLYADITTSYSKVISFTHCGNGGVNDDRWTPFPVKRKALALTTMVKEQLKNELDFSGITKDDIDYWRPLELWNL